MKRAVLWASVILLFAAGSVAMAGAQKDGDKDKKGHLQKAMMMKQMMSKQMVATSDGGVVVLVGRKLMKYDKNLKLKAEAEIAVDKSFMKKMMKDCPMSKMKDAQAGKEETPVVAETPEQPSGE